MTQDPPICWQASRLRFSRRALLSVFVLGGALLAVADTVQFDHYTSPTDNDLVNYFNNPGGLTQTTSGGILGSGAVRPTAFNENPVYKPSFNPITGGGLSALMAFQFDPTVLDELGGGPSLQLGFVGSPDVGLDFFSEFHYFHGEFANDGSLYIFSRVGAMSEFSLVDTLDQPPTPGHWLGLTFSELYLGSDQFLLSVSLADYGASGTEYTLLGEGSITRTHAIAAADPTVFGSFNGYYHVSAFDNFTMVPEPGTMVLWGLGLWGMVMAARKKRVLG